MCAAVGVGVTEGTEEAEGAVDERSNKALAVKLRGAGGQGRAEVMLDGRR